MDKIKTYLLGILATALAILAFLWKRAEGKALLAKLKHLKATEETLKASAEKKKEEIASIASTLKDKKAVARDLAKRFREKI